MTPTARTLKKLRDMGYQAAVCEKWNAAAHKRQDLHGIADIHAFNYAHTLSQQDFIGTASTPNDQFGRTLRILNPRVFRFGVRFEF